MCINFKGFSRDGVTSTIVSGHIATFMFKVPSCGFNFQYIILLKCKQYCFFEH